MSHINAEICMPTQIFIFRSYDLNNNDTKRSWVLKKIE
jgi:hypothetical protein